MTNRAASLLFVLLLAVLLVPLVAVQHPPLQDYPNHLARLFILSHPSDPYLARFYAPAWALKPNLAFDLIGLGLAQLMSVDLAGRVYLAISFAVVASAPIALHRALWGKLSPVAFWGCPLVFGLVLQKGFLGYLLDAGLAIWAYAIWIATSPLKPWQRLTIAQVAAIVLFVGHLYALGVFALLIVVHEFAARTRARGVKQGLAAALRSCAPFIVPAAAFLMASPTKGGETHFVTGTGLLGKLLFPLVSLAPLGTPLGFVILGGVFLPVAASLAARRAPLHRDALWPVAVLGLCLLAIPPVLFSVANADWRISLPLALVVVGAARDPFEGKVGRAGAVAMPFALSAAASYLCLGFWMQGDRITAEFDRVTADLAPGSTVLSVILDPGYYAAVYPPAYQHIGARVVLRSSFSPSVFAHPTQQPLARRAPWDRMPEGYEAVYYGPDAKPLDWTGVAKLFDHLLLIHTAPSSFGTAPDLPIAARPVARSRRFVLYDILSARPHGRTSAQTAEGGTKAKLRAAPAFGKN